jgi:hypothetical protein
MSNAPEFENQDTEPQPYTMRDSDQAFLDAFRIGGEAEISLIKIEPSLWLKGIIGIETHRLPGQIGDEELLDWLQGKGGWQAK